MHDVGAHGLDAGHAGVHDDGCADVDDRRAARDERGRIVRAILWYQRAVEGRPSPCRFFPSCSSYALEAVEVHGNGRGARLAVRRLLRCRPFGPSGYDPVPDPDPPREEVR